jgi:hypothetical protein
MSAAADERARMAHFDTLTRDEQAEAIRQLARDGFGDYEIAAACKLAVEVVRQILGEPRS